MVPFLNNQKGYNCSATHSVSLFVSTTTRRDCFRPYQLALDPSRPPLLVATENSRSNDRSVNRLLRIGTYPVLERIPCWNVSRIEAYSVLEYIPYWNISRIGTDPVLELPPGPLIAVAAVSSKLDPSSDLPTPRMALCAESLPKFRSWPSSMFNPFFLGPHLE